jgi:hypothetical protein
MRPSISARIAAAAALSASPPLLAPSAHHASTAAGAGYARAVTSICSGALLFEHAHAVGSDAGARAAAEDIRRSARGRLDRVAAVPAPSSLRREAARWLALQRRLAASYADNWLLIHAAIDAARTPAERARLPRTLNAYVHAPDALRAASHRLEAVLGVPDCTGGG